MIGVAGLFCLVGGKLFFLQIWRHSYYDAVAASQREHAYELLPHRGTIYMSDGQDQDYFPVAVNKQAWIAYAVPRDMDDPKSVSDQLAPLLQAFRQRERNQVHDILVRTGQLTNGTTDPTANQPSADDETAALRDQLFAKFNRHTDPYAPLLRPDEVLDDQFKQALDQAKLPGIILEEKEVRFYPEHTLAAHVLGYVGWQDNQQLGRYGIEGFLQNTLAGSLGFLSSEKDAAGRVIGVGSNQFRPASDGSDVVLTVDRVIQSIIEEELAAGVKKYGAERGSIIVMNPKTGAILGMATYPTFDPNYYYAVEDGHVQVNPVVSDIFEPGSILKPVVMAAAIEEQKVTPDTTMVDNGPVHVADRVINTFDGKHHGKITMTQILEQSNNVGMVWVGQQLGPEIMYDYFRRFGLGEKTGIELQGETQNTIPPPNKWNIVETATSSFGQGIALTPLQALNAINVIANHGKLMQPYIVDRLRDSNGTEHVHEPTMVRQVVSPTTADTVNAMMVSVVEKGVAQLARVPGYYLAGKTGTAQVADDTGHYSPDKKIISFAGFGPARDPQFSILIKLDNPAGLSFASGTAAPMFHNIADKILNYMQVSPDYSTLGPRPDFTVSGSPAPQAQAHDPAG